MAKRIKNGGAVLKGGSSVPKKGELTANFLNLRPLPLLVKDVRTMTQDEEAAGDVADLRHYMTRLESYYSVYRSID